MTGAAGSTAGAQGAPDGQAPDLETALAPGDTTPDREAPVPSSALLHGRCCLEISHNGMIYRLTVTRLGKLILTK